MVREKPLNRFVFDVLRDYVSIIEETGLFSGSQRQVATRDSETIGPDRSVERRCGGSEIPVASEAWLNYEWSYAGKRYL